MLEADFEGWAQNDINYVGSHTHQKFRKCCRLVTKYFHVISKKLEFVLLR